MTGLELSLWTILAWSSQRFTCLYFLSAGIKGVRHHSLPEEGTHELCVSSDLGKTGLS